MLWSGSRGRVAVIAVVVQVNAMRLKRTRPRYISRRHPWIWRYPRLVTHCSASLRPFLRLFFSFSRPFLLLSIPHTLTPQSRSGCSLFCCTISPSGSRLTFFSGLVLSISPIPCISFLSPPLPHTTTTPYYGVTILFLLPLSVDSFQGGKHTQK